MVSFIHQNQLESGKIIFAQAITRNHALYECHRDICCPRSLDVAHFDVNALPRVCPLAMTSSLFHQFLSMGQDECLLCSIVWRRNSINELGEDDSLATTGSQGDSEAVVAIFQI